MVKDYIKLTQKPTSTAVALCYYNSTGTTPDANKTWGDTVEFFNEK